jgi:predicted membrane channel-forming protein YqfA (hemolysin III family)
MRVVVTDIKMPLGSMVVFMLKLMVASIPATVVVWLVIGLLSLLFGGIFALSGC